MSNRILLGTALLAFAFALQGQQTFYQIDLVPSGMLLSAQPPASKGTTLVFRRFPDGTLMSLRKTDVKKVSQITRDQALLSPADQVVQIGTLAMQGGSSQAGPTNVNAVRPRGAAKTGPELGQGFYSNVIPGETTAMPNSANDYQIGRTYAYAPSNATQSSSGAPPTNPSATSGSNPPQ